MWIKLLVCALTAWMIKGQLPEDDEVDITIPGYKHRIYSGMAVSKVRIFGHRHNRHEKNTPLCFAGVPERCDQGPTAPSAHRWPWLLCYQRDGP